MLRIYCKNTRSFKEFSEGTTLEDMLPAFSFDRPYPIVSAKVNNVSQGLRFRVYNNRDIEFLDLRDASARRVYCRSLCFLLCKAAQDVFPQAQMDIKHSISNGYFCELHKGDGDAVTETDVQRIKARMQEIIAENMPFHRREVRLEEAVEIFRAHGYEDKVRLLETSGQPYVDYYLLGDTVDYYYGRLLPSTGYIEVWDIVSYRGGILLRVPDRRNPDQLAPFMDQPKTFDVFSEDFRWNSIMNLRNAGDVNRICSQGGASDLIQIADLLHHPVNGLSVQPALIKLLPHPAQAVPPKVQEIRRQPPPVV